jgi:hypothetical protein
MTTHCKPEPLSTDDLNRMEADRKASGQDPDPVDVGRLLDLAVLFRNALREIQVIGNRDAKEIATKALNSRKRVS